MNTQTLIAAIRTIASITGKDISAIQFEDGSGYKFNYQTVDNSSNWQYIDLTTNEDMIYHHNPPFINR